MFAHGHFKLERLMYVILLLVCSTNIYASIWPAPVTFNILNETLIPLSSDFKFVTSSNTPAAANTFLLNAYSRYQELLNTLPHSASSSSGETLSDIANYVPGLRVYVQSTILVMSLDVDESYTLQVIGPDREIELNASTVFGALRGLETFIQLCDLNVTLMGGGTSVPASVVIKDQPRFAYRGLMMDLSRHYYAVDAIAHTMDAMVASKLNVLHLHLTDDQSIPIFSPSFPNLTALASFRVHGVPQIYSKSDIQYLLNYATQRGILIIPEFDMPAHSSAWGAAFPTDMVTGQGCSPVPFTHGDTLDPSSESMFEHIDTFLGDMITLFGPGGYLHLGGDEVPVTCWNNSVRVKAWMATQGPLFSCLLPTYLKHICVQ